MGLFSKAGALIDDKLRALLAVSAYEEHFSASEPDDESQDQLRKAMGGNISPMPINQPRWYLRDLEDAMRISDGGDLQKVGELCRALRKDGMIQGLLSTRTEGLVQLPLRFYGNEEQIQQLKARNGTRSLFSEMFPPGELALLAGDGILAGVGVAELVPVQGRDFPIMIRRDPAYLRYRWNEGRWYFTASTGQLPITPGDGRWILHTPCGREAPWQQAAWKPLGRAFITKEHSMSMRMNYSAKLANPARIATSPQASSADQKVSWFEQVLNWGMNTVFHVTPGYKVELLELRGQGYKVFAEDIELADHETMICLAGQEVTTTGGAGFSNMDLFRSIKADLIKATGDALAYTINTQGIPAWVVNTRGIDALDGRAIIEWDTNQPKDQSEEAAALSAIANAIAALRREARKDGRELDANELYNRFSVPLIMRANDNDAAPESGVREIVKPVDIAPDVLEKLIEIAKANGLQVAQSSLSGAAAALGVKFESPAVVTAPGVVDSNMLTDEQLDPDGDGLPGEPATDESVAALADKMTAAGVSKCEHGSSNRCRLCGIERVRDFEPGPDGEPVWKVAWRPIPKQQEAA